VLAVAIPLLVTKNTPTTSGANTGTASSNFPQSVTTTAYITSIAVGTGYTSGPTPDGINTTFRVGDTVYLVCDLATAGGTSFSDILTVDSTTVSMNSGLSDLTDSTYYGSATVQTQGIYTWKVNYTTSDGTQGQASITFQAI
jgi:hypothetical protein